MVCLSLQIEQQTCVLSVKASKLIFFIERRRDFTVGWKHISHWQLSRSHDIGNSSSSPPLHFILTMLLALRSTPVSRGASGIVNATGNDEGAGSVFLNSWIFARITQLALIQVFASFSEGIGTGCGMCSTCNVRVGQLQVRTNRNNFPTPRYTCVAHLENGIMISKKTVDVVHWW